MIFESEMGNKQFVVNKEKLLSKVYNSLQNVKVFLKKMIVYMNLILEFEEKVFYYFQVKKFFRKTKK